MRTTIWLKRLFGSVGVLLVVLVLIAGITATTWLRRPFPQMEGSLQVAGPTATIDIYRDPAGTPHIYAQNRADMLFANGYVHAQDRFWQMELSRRAAQGRLAEVIGPAGLETDRFNRTIGFNRIASNALSVYQAEYPEVVADLNAYSAGVNAYLAEHKQNVSFNHTFLNLTRPWPIEPWTPYDTISFGAFMAWSFEYSWKNDYTNTLVAEAVGPAKAELLLPSYPDDRPSVVAAAAHASRRLPPRRVDPGIAAIFARKDGAREAIPAAIKQIGPLPPGSNAWVVSGAYTVSGKPMLANDPHVQAVLPSNFYQIGLHSPGFDVVGFSLPAGPGVIIGRNQHISWGLTNAVVDVQDSFVERLNPANPLQYDVNGTWHDVETVQEVIKVASSADDVLDVHLTRHGPIVMPVGDSKTEAIAVQWQAHQRPFRLFKAILDLNTASSHSEFRTALSYWDAPAISFVYADTDGNIAYQLAANVPVRANETVRRAVPGWTDEHEWTGWVAYEDLPSVVNPQSGYIVAANNQITPERFPTQYVVDPGDRAQRISGLIQQKIDTGQKLSAEDFTAMQRDYYSSLAQTYTPLMIDLAKSEPQLQPIVERLRTWNYQLAPESPEAGFFSIFLMKLSEQVYRDDLGALYADHTSDGVLSVLTSLRLLAADPSAALWDNSATPAAETRNEIVLSAMRDTLSWLQEQKGSAIDSWQWGKIHTVTFRSLPLGISGVLPLEKLVNRGPYPVGGDVTTVNDHSWTFNNIGETIFYPTLRFIADMHSADATRGLSSIGQSGHPTHANYADLIQPSLEGRTMPMPLNPADVASWQHLVLTPSSSR